jgi:PAS domain S-box-containing protein
MQNFRFVRTNYFVRTVAFLMCLAALGLHLWDRGASPAAWLLLALQFAVYPHLLYLRARYSATPNRAELDNLLLDSVLLGAWCALLGFPLWITYALVAATTLNSAVNRGAQGVFWSLLCNLAGAGIGVAIHGFEYSPATIPAVTAICIFGSLWYAAAIGRIVRVQNRRLSAARDAVRASEARYRLIAENAADLIAIVDADGHWRYTSPSYSKLLDAVDLEPIAEVYSRLHPDDAAMARAAVARVAETGAPRELRLRLVDREGRVRRLNTHVAAVGPEGGPRRVLLASQDVTDLRESEERLLLAAHALEGMTEAILITAADGTIVTVNRAFCEVTGYEREEVLGRPEKEIRNALQPEAFYAELYDAVARDGYWSGTTWCRRKNGSVYREWRSVRAVRDAAGAVSHYVMVFYEVGGRDNQAAETPLRA